MDTRNKILTAEAALAALSGRPMAIVSGMFDVLRAGHVRELEEVRSHSACVLVVVLSCADELLTLRARVELIAALRAVDYVVSGGPEELERLIRELHPVYAKDLRDLDAELRRELKARVK